MKILRIILYIAIFVAITFDMPYKQPVRFTSYYPNDGTGSSTCTASGLCASDLDNVDGEYYYQGRLVIATANYDCTASDKGVCARYNDLPIGFHQYNLYDKLTIIYKDHTTKAIVLDVCGACYWEEPNQRYDIFVSGSEAASDTSGQVIIPGHLRIYMAVIYVLIFILTIAFLLYCKHKHINIKRNLKHVKSYLITSFDKRHDN